MPESDGHPRPPVRRNLPLLFLQAREQLMAHFRPVLNAHGITEQQWRILRLLFETGPLEPHRIGDICRLSSPSLAGVISRLQQMKWVKKKRLAEDQRRVRVSLTERGRRVAAGVLPEIEAVYARVLDHLGQEFAAQIHTMLDTVIARLESQPAVKSVTDATR